MTNTMTKQQFAILALALKAQMPVWIENYNSDSRERTLYEHVYRQWVRDVNAILEVCVKTNPRFSKGKFLEACGIPNLLME